MPSEAYVSTCSGGYDREVEAAIAMVIVAIIGLISTMVGRLPETKKTHRRIERNLELLDRLPSDSKAAAELRAHVESQVESLVANESKLRRDPFSVFLGITFLILAAGMGWMCLVYGSWWWLSSPVALFFVLLGIVGIAEGAKKQDREKS